MMMRSEPGEIIGLSIPDVPPCVAKRAVEWILELQASSEPEKTGAAIRDWCARDPDHRQAWEHVERVNQRFNLLATPERINIAQRALCPISR